MNARLPRIGRNRLPQEPGSEYNGSQSSPAESVPHSLDAESGIISSILKSPEQAIGECHGKISEHHFYSPTHRTIYTALTDMWDAGKAIDLLTFTQFLRDQNLLEQVGGAAYVTEVQDYVASAANVRCYIDIVLEKHRARETVLLGKAMAAGAVGLAEARSKIEVIDEQSEDGRPRLEDIAATISKDIVLPTDVIEGLLHKGGKMVIGGGSKSFKTWQLIEMGISVATGADYLGFATTRGRILYINLELPSPYFASRCKTVAEAKLVKLENGFFDVLNMRGHAGELRALLPEFMRRAGRGKYSLIFADPIYKLLGEREENVTHHITAMMNDLETLAVRSGAAVAFGAHFSKGNQAGKESIDRISGSGAFARDPDTILTLTRHEEEDAFTVEATLRNHRPIEPFVIKWNFPLMVREETLDPTRLKQAGGRPRAATPAEILDLLDEKPLTATEWQKRAREEFGIASSTFYELKSSLAKHKPKPLILNVTGKFIKSCTHSENSEN
jgi:hypothetical protein